MTKEIQAEIFDAIFIYESIFNSAYDKFTYLESDDVEYVFKKNGDFLCKTTSLETYGYFVGGWNGDEFLLFKYSYDADQIFPPHGKYWIVSPMFVSSERDLIWIKDDIGFQYEIDKDGNIAEYEDD